ncbi:hypothetical protein [Streptomyces guryensis]|uniref:Uncharacterized protein n=1 Tax=Streptomyces guryensis TaxID=2886947 RepID=A0A9Q3VGQ3_9ACTN|nr:hypothetical protein [Streptomyces guryensis]MCD9872313.1 hypothetical protein [Streptomyces guryensis]
MGTAVAEGTAMEWTVCAVYGALGGLVVEAVAFYGRIAAWQRARHQALARNRKRLPGFGKYVDAPSDIAVALTRLGLGAGAGIAFHSQLTGPLAALAVGASAPALIAQLGGARTVQEVLGGARATAPESGVASPSVALPKGAEAVEP